MKEVRSLIGWMLIVMILLSPLAIQAQMSPVEQGAVREIDGHIAFKIESRTMTVQEADAAVANGTPITLKVSAIFRGDWVSLLDKGFQAYFNQSSFSFGIAQTAGDNIGTPAPFYKDNTPALIGAHYNLAITCNPNDPFVAEASSMYISMPSWNQNKETNHCPLYDYGLGMSSNANFNTAGYRVKRQDAKGDYYEVDLFPITLKLKRRETIYVRGVDDQGTYKTDNASEFYATSGTTELNINNFLNQAVLYWPGSPSTTTADWTQAPKEYYGGIIPGGIFIEQSPEVAQFEPCQQRKTA